MHDMGNTGTVFDRLDWQPNAKDAFHLNVIGARNWMQVPNTYAQPAQDQRRRMRSPLQPTSKPLSAFIAAASALRSFTGSRNALLPITAPNVSTY